MRPSFSPCVREPLVHEELGTNVSEPLSGPTFAVQYLASMAGEKYLLPEQIKEGSTSCAEGSPYALTRYLARSPPST